MNKVEFTRVHPLILQVIDFEFDVWWHERGLDGADVVAEDFSRGVLRMDKHLHRCLDV